MMAVGGAGVGVRVGTGRAVGGRVVARGAGGRVGGRVVGTGVGTIVGTTRVNVGRGRVSVAVGWACAVKSNDWQLSKISHAKMPNPIHHRLGKKSFTHTSEIQSTHRAG